MKTKLFLLSILSVGIVASCQGPEGKRAETREAEALEMRSSENTRYHSIDPERSKVEWLGKKPGGEHFGYVKLKNGTLIMEEGSIAGGSFTIEMNTITVEDLEDPEYNKKLTAHLKSADFFNVNEYPESEFVITRVAGPDDPGILQEGGQMYKITGNLKIKDIEKSISFDAVVDQNAAEISASTPQFVIDRTDWDVKFKSKSFFEDLKNDFIHDDIGLKIHLAARK